MIDDGADIEEMGGLVKGLIAAEKTVADMNDRTQLYVFEAEEQKEKTFEELVKECGFSCKKHCEDPAFKCMLKSLNALGVFPPGN